MEILFNKPLYQMEILFKKALLSKWKSCLTTHYLNENPV